MNWRKWLSCIWTSSKSATSINNTWKLYGETPTTSNAWSEKTSSALSGRRTNKFMTCKWGTKSCRTRLISLRRTRNVMGIRSSLLRGNWKKQRRNLKLSKKRVWNWVNSYLWGPPHHLTIAVYQLRNVGSRGSCTTMISTSRSWTTLMTSSTGEVELEIAVRNAWVQNTMMTIITTRRGPNCWSRQR